jgi:hypothetical protein
MKVVRDIRGAWPVSKMGSMPLMGIYPWNSITATNPQWRSYSRAATIAKSVSKPGALALQERRHSFAIEALPKGEGSKSPPYLYMCVRCKWTFRVNDRPGSIFSIDQTGQPLAEPENSQRAATFAVGPCPALKGLIRRQTVEIPSLGWFARTKRRLIRQVSAMWRHWSGESAHGIRIDPAATITITADDLLR